MFDTCINCSHCALILQTMAKQATCQEYAMEAPPKKCKSRISDPHSTKEKETVRHYFTYFLEDRSELVQVSIGNVPDLFFTSLWTTLKAISK